MEHSCTPRAGGAGALVALSLALAAPAAGQSRADAALDADLALRIEEVMPKVVEWRRDIHQHPELSNREFRTAALVAEHLRGLGLDVQTGVAHTGVVAVLEGGLPGPVVALRADMDGLPVTELVDLPFASRERAEYNGQEVGVMHACGHDNHVAILMGVAEVLTGLRDRLPGTVKFIFQPAEEGPPAGETGGAPMMVAEGVLDDPAPTAIFGLHVGVVPRPAGHISYRAAGIMAAADNLKITVHGSQTHGAMPWAGVDPVATSAQIVNGLQTIVSRQSNLVTGPAVVTIGTINGGIRHNIVPDSVVMTGTIRTLDPEMRREVHERVRRTAEMIAAAAGATAVVEIEEGAPVTYNDPDLTARMAPTLERVAGAGNVTVGALTMGAEDFAYFQERIPGLYFFLGVVPEGQDLSTVAPNHSPHFFADESALPTGVRAMSQLAIDYLASGGL